MDTTALAASNNISVQLVKDSPSKKLTIISSGAMVLDKEGNQKFQCLVEIDGTQKSYKPNKTTIKALHEKYGKESSAWIGKTLELTLGEYQGKPAIYGKPI